MEEMNCVSSSNLGWARYDEAARVLEVDFKDKNGVRTTTYSYAQFNLSDWEEFKNARSKGEHFAYKIRPRWVGVKIAGPPAKAKAEPEKPGELFNGD